MNIIFLWKICIYCFLNQLQDKNRVKKKKKVMTMTTMEAIDKPDIKNTAAGKGHETHLLSLDRPNWLPPKRLLRNLE